jgi:hypothetical protein
VQGVNPSPDMKGRKGMKKKWVYAFEEGDGKNKMLLGGKGANLCEMTQIGLNVPPGFHRHHRGLPGLPGERTSCPRA